MARRYYSREKRERDRAIYAPIACEESAPLEVDPRRVWADVESNLMQTAEKPSMLDSLPTSVVRLMISKGFIIRVDAGTVVTKAGHGEREMYVILDGVFDGNDCRVALLTKGDPFGEVAFFRGSGRRSASVRAVEAGRVLVLRRRFLRELMSKKPDAAAKILYNLARVLADRLGSMVQERQLSQIAEEVDAKAPTSGTVERETG
jgi:signal-transduction protein with cAMP-binding, CBS, and nucleotidyltransferase domain